MAQTSNQTKLLKILNEIFQLDQSDLDLDNLRCDEDHHKVKLIEQEFKRLMFNE